MNQPNLALAKKLNIAAWILSAIVLLVVGGMRQIKIDTDIDFTFKFKCMCGSSISSSIVFYKK